MNSDFYPYHNDVSANGALWRRASDLLPCTEMFYGVIWFEIFQVKPISTILISSHDTKLNYIKGFTVMKKTGKVVIKGRSSEFSPYFLHVYTLHGKKIGSWKIKGPMQAQV